MIKTILKTTLLAAALISLAGCGTAHKAPCSDVYDSGAAAGDGTCTNGMGQGSSFNANGDYSIPGHCTMTVANQSYYFDFDSNNVHPADMGSIHVQGHYLATHPNAKVLLTGNTDERGSREYNIALGEHRADSVAAILEADGVNKNQITTVSYGAEKPVALGHDEDSYSKNRRVDLIYQTQIG